MGEIGSVFELGIYRKLNEVMNLCTLYIKRREVNTATRNIKKYYFRVDKKITS